MISESQKRAIKKYQGSEKGKRAMKRVMKRFWMKRLYGLSLERWDEMVAEQGGKCFICGDIPKRLIVDHNHTTGKVRRILCINCNTYVGHIERRPDLINTIMEYLKEHSD